MGKLLSWKIILLLSAPLVLVFVFGILFPKNVLVFIFSYMACVKYLPIFTMARLYEHRPIFNTGHIGENEK